MCLHTSRASSTEVLNIHTRYMYGNLSTSVTEVQKYTYNVLTWKLQYFCSRSTEVHKYTSSLSYLLPLDRSTEVLNIHTRYLHGNFSTSVTEVHIQCSYMGT